jgi:hypothetical protein
MVMTPACEMKLARMRAAMTDSKGIDERIALVPAPTSDARDMMWATGMAEFAEDLSDPENRRDNPNDTMKLKVRTHPKVDGG